MTSSNLENLARIGQLRSEPPAQDEFDGLVASGRKRLRDAHNATLTPESRFDLAYNAAHALSLAALRWHGYRSNNRYLVFQVLTHTLGMRDDQCRLLSLCHERRNDIEYSGTANLDESLLSGLITVAGFVLESVEKLGRVGSPAPPPL